jgi:hypothetical protein
MLMVAEGRTAGAPCLSSHSKSPLIVGDGTVFLQKEARQEILEYALQFQQNGF